MEDEASNVGLGWELEPNAAITQIVNGKRDGLDQLPTRNVAGYVYLKNQGLNSAYHERHGNDLMPCHTNYSGDSFTTFTYLQQNEG